MAGRAGVSEGVFFEIFPTVEECYSAAVDVGLERLSQTVRRAASGGSGWLGRVRTGLVALLGFLDDGPGWGRLLVSDMRATGAVSRARQQRVANVLTCLLDSRRRDGVSIAGAPTAAVALRTELVVGGVFAVIRTSMLEGDGAPLVELAPSLMSFIEVQYGGRGVGRHVAAEVKRRSEPLGGGAVPAVTGGVAPAGELARTTALARTSELPIRATHRTMLVLRAIARAPYLNNREVARAAGLSDEGQTSKLLARLERQGVIENVGLGPARGEPNAWLLTASGERALALIAQGSSVGAPRRRRARAGGAA